MAPKQLRAASRRYIYAAPPSGVDIHISCGEPFEPPCPAVGVRIQRFVSFANAARSDEELVFSTAERSDAAFASSVTPLKV
jgi:hypothetical protein